MSTPFGTEASTALGSQFEHKSENLAGTLKWLVASAGAIAVAVVAGLQLTSLQELRAWAALIAILGAVLALSSVGIVLFGAARVLALQTSTVTELVNREAKFGLLQDDGLAAMEKIAAEDPVLKWVYERRTLLMGDSRSVTELYTDEFVASGNTLAALARNETRTLAGRDLRPDQPADIAWVRTKQAQAEGHIQLIEAAVACQQRFEAYQHLVTRIKRLAVWFVLGIFVFALAPVLGSAPKATEFTHPIPAQIHVIDAELAGVPQNCPAILKGQIVGGTLQDPVVVTEPVGACPALRLTAGPDALIVIPEAIPWPELSR